MTSQKDIQFIREAIDVALAGISGNKGGPFGTVILKGEKVVGRGSNEVVSSNDPTAHAEMIAIRNACKYLRSHQLTGCTLYTSCEPCPMCLGAIYWARPDRVVYACTRQDAASIGFDDDFIYNEIKLPPDHRRIPMIQCGREESLAVFQLWEKKADKVQY
jgi:guanine deaminase